MHLHFKIAWLPIVWFFSKIVCPHSGITSINLFASNMTDISIAFHSSNAKRRTCMKNEKCNFTFRLVWLLIVRHMQIFIGSLTAMMTVAMFVGKIMRLIVQYMPARLVFCLWVLRKPLIQILDLTYKFQT